MAGQVTRPNYVKVKALDENMEEVVYEGTELLARAFCHEIDHLGVISSLCLTTAGLVIMLGYNFYAIMPGRLVQFAIMTPIYCVLTCLLYFSPLTSMVAGHSSSAVLEKRTV